MSVSCQLILTRLTLSLIASSWYPITTTKHNKLHHYSKGSLRSSVFLTYMPLSLDTTGGRVNWDSWCYHISSITKLSHPSHSLTGTRGSVAPPTANSSNWRQLTRLLPAGLAYFYCKFLLKLTFCKLRHMRTTKDQQSPSHNSCPTNKHPNI